jgi:hypothetical protein
VTTVLLAAVCCRLCFTLCRKLLGSDAWALAATWLVVTNYHAVLTTPTFLRDIPALFAVLVLLHAVVRGSPRWTLGLCFLLVLDAKEYLFFMFAPAYVAWVLLSEWQELRGKPASFLAGVFHRCAAGFLPGAVYLLLMFCTGIVPVNMFAAYILGITETGISDMLFAFFPGVATSNLWETGREMVQFPVPGGVAGVPVAAANLLLAYTGKLLYPRTFSFIAVPKILVVPAVAMSVSCFRRWRREGQVTHAAVPLFFWAYLAIYVLRWSHGRYLLPVVPLFALFFVDFLQNGLRDRRTTVHVLAWTTVFVALGFAFEKNYVWVKAVLGISSLAVLALAALAGEGKHATTAARAAVAVPLVVGGFAMAAALASSLLLPGQIGHFLALGHNRECRLVMEELGPGDRVWVNDIGWGMLPLFHTRDRVETPEWKWMLKDVLPKKRMLHRYEFRQTYSFEWDTAEELHDAVERFGITRVGLLVSRHPRYTFPQEDALGALRNAPWLELTRVLPLKNKELYDFCVR